MQNKINKNVNVSTRIIVTFLLSLSILMAQSIYLIIFMSILCLIMIILTQKSVKQYLHLVKKLKFWLLFIFITYIIIFRNIIGSFLFLYKIILILFLIKQVSISTNLEDLINAINTLIKIITKKQKKNIAYDIGLTLYFIKYYVNSIDILNKKYNDKVFMNKFNLKCYILPRIFMATNKIKEIENSLKIKCYTPMIETQNIKSNILLFIFFILFIAVIIKEVIM